MLKLGLKCSYFPEQLYDRLQYRPDIIELHLNDDDLFGDKRKKLENTISMLLREDIEVYLHHPSKYNGRYLNIIHEQKEDYLFYHLSTRILADICLSHSIKCVIHPHYIQTDTSSINKENNDKIVNEIKHILSYGKGVFLWENSIYGLFTAQNPNWFEEIVRPLKLPLAYDISHAFISFRGNKRLLLEQIEKLDSYIQYFHVVDSEGQKHDGLQLGAGRIDWKPILPFLMSRPYIYEITLKDITDAVEMYESHLYLVQLLKHN
ncbi:TIM barrel protein [Neobacillus ginsengisoli]|uniref:Sugar phosphate isomerase/epimerase n=1 Tax=Neobacillus ginsengisoli TaxID=904295 RepID=A0ABT9XUP9_9BACI|nr:TIM barrel protein [Neobacillus ginsengisoli]MDQ0199226.1 sugar phosphate isomerase/epimerase [Neobacillus ginsengisoli]